MVSQLSGRRYYEGQLSWAISGTDRAGNSIVLSTANTGGGGGQSELISALDFTVYDSKTFELDATPPKVDSLSFTTTDDTHGLKYGSSDTRESSRRMQN